VEVIDSHNGFDAITSRIQTTKLAGLMWLVGFVTFFLSAVLDNLTSTIVMISLIRKLLEQRPDRLFFAALIVIAANAGGAWTPIGDVTTTMLWIGGQITSLAIMKALILPSLVNLIVPLLVVSYFMKGREVIAPAIQKNSELLQTTGYERNLMFCNQKQHRSNT
jgi:Na+/H+ antiporter NhaD/arsenite permease-like protein